MVFVNYNNSVVELSTSYVNITVWVLRSVQHNSGWTMSVVSLEQGYLFL